eukprot:IDg2806t1
MPIRGAGRMRTALAVGSGAAILFFSPAIIHFSKPEQMISTEEALKPEAVRRGAFNNSGSRDCGPDPDWIDGRYRPLKKTESGGSTTPVTP